MPEDFLQELEGVERGGVLAGVSGLRSKVFVSDSSSYGASSDTPFSGKTGPFNFKLTS